MESGIFSKKSNYNEFVKKSSNKSKFKLNKCESDPIPDISTLSDGVYNGIRYGYTLELEDGRKFKTKTGVRHRRQYSKKEIFTIENGDIISIKSYSGMAEVSAGMQGMSYGKKASRDQNVTRVTVDTSGFKIPNKVINKFKLNRTQMYSNNGVYKGDQNTPQLKISDDNSIIRNKTNGGTQQSTSNSMSVKYSKNATFNLSIEPWIVSPLMSDITEGIYVGKLLGDTISSGIYKLMLSVKLNKQIPEDVVVFVKDAKAYVFRLSQLTDLANKRSAVFSNNIYDRNYSEIKSDDQFREYAHTLMKNAHKDNYSKELTDKVVSDLLNKSDSKDYGELIGRLRSGLKNKSYADPSQDKKSSQSQSTPGNPTQSASQSTPGGMVNEQPSSQQDPNQNQPQESNKVIGDPFNGFSFEYAPSTNPEYTMESVIGTILMSAAFAHLYHLCTPDYVYHISLDKYYNTVPGLVDKLAEAYLAKVDSVTLKYVIVPNSANPIEYLTSLKDYIRSYIESKSTVPELEEYKPYLDDIISCINSTLYPMKRLKEGKKTFSIDDNSVGLSDLYDKRSVGGVPSKDVKRSIKDLIKLIQNQKSAPNFKDIKNKKGKLERQYVQIKSTDWRAILDIISGLGDAADITLKSLK